MCVDFDKNNVLILCIDNCFAYTSLVSDSLSLYYKTVTHSFKEKFNYHHNFISQLQLFTKPTSIYILIHIHVYICIYIERNICIRTCVCMCVYVFTFGKIPLFTFRRCKLYDVTAYTENGSILCSFYYFYLYKEI